MRGIVRAKRTPHQGDVTLDHRADIARSTTRAATSAAAREFFGGIWFKIFTERGPSRITLTP
jgi:hypothetical protein